MEVRFGDKDLDRLETDPRFDGGYPQEVVKMFRKRMQAIRAAEADGWQTLTIRISLAEALLRLSRPVEARAELLACRDEMEASEDEFDRWSWSDLMAECERLLD